MRNLLLLLLIFICYQAKSQCNTCSVTTFNVDLSASVDTVYSIQSVRNGNCCTGSNCVRFNIKINPGSSFVNFSVANPAPNGAAYYQINCGPQTSLGTPACVSGQTNVCIVYCKPGNDNPTYTITTSSAIRGSKDLTLREGCTGSMNIIGLVPATINWTSVYPGAIGAYNSYLSCTTGCATTNVTPQSGAPPYIDYMVSGSKVCNGVGSDTIRIYTAPPLTVSVSPANAALCAGGSGTVTLTATVAGGQAPYKYSWNTGQTTPSITVNSAGTYSVSVSDSTIGCSPVVQTVKVETVPPLPVPTVSNSSPVCSGNTLKLFASAVAGAAYQWTGPNGFTSTLQNPVIPNATIADAGNYSVTITLNGCTSSASTTTAVINPAPPLPTVSSNSPLCVGGTLLLTASSSPGASYSWTGPNSFTSFAQNPSIQNVQLKDTGTYTVIATMNGCSSAAASVYVIVNAPQTPVAENNGPVCEGQSLNFTCTAINGATSYSWTGPNGFSATTQNPVITNVTLAAEGRYTVTPIIPGCSSFSASTSVTIKPTPASPTVSNNSPVCAGSDVKLFASGTNTSTYTWVGPNTFISTAQNLVITSAGTSESGTYSVTVTENGCTSLPVGTIVTVNPIPAIPTASSNTLVCEGKSINLFASSPTSVTYAWSGPNGFSAASQNPSITNGTVANGGTYYVTATAAGCTSVADSIFVQVNQNPLPPTVSSNAPVCEGEVLTLNASSINGATYSWTGPNNFSSAVQNPSIPNAASANGGTYKVLVTVSGCASQTPSSVSVTIKPVPSSPVVASNSPLCEGSNLNLAASSSAGASYSWTGPNGFLSTLQNPVKPNVTSTDSGTYSVQAFLNGCASTPGTTAVIVNQKAIVNAGSNQTVCANAPVYLSGSVTGGSTTGIWSTNGSGTYSPSASSLNGVYKFSNADIAAGTVLLTLSSTNNGACPVVTNAVTISITLLPTANAGLDQTVCANNANVNLNGRITIANGGVWTTSGIGTFMPSATSLNATYVPSTNDKTNRNVTLTLTTTGNSNCLAASDVMVVTISPGPSVNAGPDRYVVENNSVQLKPSVKGTGLHYLWTPNLYLNNDTLLNPTCTPLTDQQYQFIVTDGMGCSASDDVWVKVLKKLVIPNAFSPNGDGIHDRFEIQYLDSYPGATVEIFNRYGQKVFESRGDAKPWDGKLNGKELPIGTYYYLIDLKNSQKPIAGFVDIIR